MRIWSVHPKYLDSKGLLALWRETLLAKSVLKQETKGYKNHPQLERFKSQSNPLNAINAYLYEVWKEALVRGYHFDRAKIDQEIANFNIPVTEGQIKYEIQHLLGKLQIRDQKKFLELSNSKIIDIHPIFKSIPGDIEKWEKVKTK